MQKETQKQKNLILEIERVITNFSRNSYFRDLFDPVQTHAIYSFHPDYLDRIKEVLKSFGANRFRLVKNGNCPILCFKIPA
jgi:hypothetical protein